MSSSSHPTAETVPMDARTLKALEGSIEKWAAIAAGTDSNQGPYNCPLCMMFNECMIDEDYAGKPQCDGCPVKESTGQAGCQGTPYQRYEEAEDFDSNMDEDDMKKLAQEELDFLKSLLPRQTP